MRNYGKLSAETSSGRFYGFVKLFRVMKLGFILVLLTIIQVKATVFGQSASLHVKNAPLIKVFEELKRQTDYDFLYASDDLVGSKPVTVSFRNEQITTILEGCLKHQPLTYTIKNATVLIKRKAMKPIVPIGLGQEEIVISGKVTDDAGLPLSGASIVVKDAFSKGTNTNNDGNFTLKLPKNSIIVVTYMGYDAKEVSVLEGGKLTIVLESGNSVLDEVVVTGYSSESKKEITGSVAIVNVDAMKTIPTGSPEQMLQGRASGLNVVTSGSPGSQSNMTIRGITSLGDNTPLVIIDGVQSSMSDINANDIESIQVLKDAGAAAIYGVRGSNGVIVVTTKKGRTVDPKITYDAYYGVQMPPGGNVFHLLNTAEMAEATWQAYRNSGQVSGNGNPLHPQYGNGASPTIPDYILIGTRTGVVGEPTAEELAQYNVDYGKGSIFQIMKANKVGTDWFHEIFSNAPIQSHTVSASSASNKSSYFFSAGYFNQQGTLMETYLKRYSARANTTFNIKDKIRIGENLYVYYKDNPVSYTGIQNTSDIGNPIMLSFLAQPIIPVFDIMGNYAGTRATGLGQSPNPYYVAKNNANYGRTSWVTQGNVFAEVDFLEYFHARTSFGGSFDNTFTHEFTPRTYQDAENNPSNVYEEGAAYTRQWTFTNTLQYARNFGDHSVKLLLGLEAMENYGRTVGGSSTGYISTDPNYLNLSSGSGNFTNYSSASKYTLSSQFGRFDYSYREKYIVSATLRRDGSSRFGSERRWGVFPAFSGGWRLSEETFAKQLSWLDNLMVRASWGIMGNQLNVDPSNAYTQFGSDLQNSYYDLNGSSNSPVQGFYATRIGNPNTGWEEDKLTNIGLDATILKNKIDFSFEYYIKSVNGLLFTDQSPATAGGAAMPTVNIGNIENKGIDLNANYHGTAGELKFDVGLNFTRYRSKILDLPNRYFDTGTTRTGNFVRNQVGHPVGAFYGYQVAGLFRDESDVSASARQDAAAPGRFKYADVIADGVITDQDRTFIGDPNPDFTYGLNLGGSFKGFDLSMFFYGSQGNDAVNYRRWWTDFFPSLQGVKSQDLLYNSWRPDNLDAKTPIVENSSNFSNNAVPNSYYIENASFLKLKSLILGYSFSSTGIKKVGIDRLRIYLQAANLFTITKYTGIDPELGGSASAFGIDYGSYPNNQRNYNLGVSVTF